jgi:outer membrane protein TolC
VEWPFANNQQEGRLLQASSRNDRQSIATEELARRIRSSVVELVTTLQQTVTQARFSETAASKYQESLDAEIELYRAGSSTLINTLLTEQRLTEARLSRVTVQQLYAQLLAQLRFVTGTLVSASEEGAMVEESSLVTLPGQAGSAS